MSAGRHEPRAKTSRRVVVRGDGVDAHFHDEPQLLYASRGVLSVTTDRGAWLRPGTHAMWIPAGTVHQHNALSALTIHTIGLPGGADPFGADTPTLVAVNRLARDVIMTLSEVADPSDAAAKRLQGVLVDQLTTTIEEPLYLPVPRDPRLSSIASAIDEDPMQVHSLQDAAFLAVVSPRTLSRLCREDLGMTFPQWRAQLRLRHALRLLGEDLSVTEVAMRSGWSTPSMFIDVFRRTLGYTPGRRRVGGSDPPATPPS